MKSGNAVASNSAYNQIHGYNRPLSMSWKENNNVSTATSSTANNNANHIDLIQ
jgi:hypothetical protein